MNAISATPGSDTFAAARVVALYPSLVRPPTLEPLGSRGGFSGASLWRGNTPTGVVCLRASAPGTPPELVAQVHRWMRLARATALPFVPTVFAALDGSTVQVALGRPWELLEWMPGQADYHSHPSPARLEEAGRALALIHRAWAAEGAGAGPCPAVQRRLACLGDWPTIRASVRDLPAPLGPVVARALRVLPGHLQTLPALLAPWASVRLPLQPCLCDVWHDHLLFTRERLTGLVDYAAMKIDNVAVDLARMLGSLVGDDEEGWATGLRAYREVRPLSEAEGQLARVLDRSGVVLGVVNWLRWLFVEGKAVDPAAAARRMEELVGRITQGWRVY